MKIIKATISNLKDIVPLFDAYRVFYEQEGDLNTAEEFLRERLENNESIIYIAYIDNKAVGFTQLYPLFSSVSMERSLVLNDLYVSKEVRAKGIGEALINEVKNLCREQNLKGLALETAQDNPAQNLYERLGFVKESGFLHYFWANS